MAPVTAIRNLGPAMARAFEAAGITTAEEIAALGTDAAYARLLASGHRPHFIGYYVIELGLQGRAFGDLTPDEKTALRTRFDRVVADTRPDAPPGIEAELDRLGVRRPQRPHGGGKP